MSQVELATALARLEHCATVIAAIAPNLSHSGEEVAQQVNAVLTDTFGPDAPEYRRAYVKPTLFKPSGTRRRAQQRDRIRAFKAGQVEVLAKLQVELDALRAKLTSPREVTFNSQVPTELRGVEARGEAGSLTPVVLASLQGVEARAEAGSLGGAVSVRGAARASANLTVEAPPFAQNNSLDVAAEIAARQRNNRAAIDASGGSMPAPLRAEAADPNNGATVVRGEAVVSASGVVLPRDWPAQRDEMHERLSTVESLLRDILPAVRAIEAAQRNRHGLGGNNPPEPIDGIPTDTAAVLEFGIDTSNVFRARLSDPLPDFWLLHYFGRALERVQATAAAFRRWLQDHREWVLAFAMAMAAEPAWKAVEQLPAAIEAALKLLGQWPM